ncbi:COX15/CtaA family protein [Acanthopleuribacter pedis]|uniref:COX15/CtaA family protein n=1 Tax=Acanthopleuribacter pedis TaxID=442870 RepID=A0A8J7QD33_9BACT|nr:COX15/CtaA family protein [Acanthopleuribacter pedis]MBO1321210.1 COX15/CtaA family protein [Acanthopleuribacter pedis]
MTLIDPQHRKPVAAWLAVVCTLTFGMIILGGLTRLTDSGLSMVDWDPIMGAVPPLNEQDWAEVFDQYRQSPQYLKENKGMPLEDFKFIFYMEYFHRLLGRFIGSVFALPWLFFAIRGWVKRPMIRHGLAILVLGGAQGVIGWYMVQSGLVDVPRVSHFRLAIHLSLGIALFSYVLCLAFAVFLPHRDHQDGDLLPRLTLPSLTALTLVGLQIVSGAFVAGLRAGHAYNTFPMMHGSFLPSAAWSYTPWISNFLENPVMVQFVHRWFAWVVAAAVVALFVAFGRRLHSRRLRVSFILLLACLGLQVTLGVLTLLTRVPVSLGSLHQAGAVILWSILLFISFHGWTRRA